MLLFANIMSAQLPKTSPRPSSVLYEQDYYLWIKNTAQLLQQDRLSEIDIANLIEEIEDIGKSEKRSVESNLEIVLMHLLKYKYQRSKISNSWLLTILNIVNDCTEFLKTVLVSKCMYEKYLMNPT